MTNDVWDKVRQATAGNFRGKVEIEIVDGQPTTVNIGVDPDVPWEQAEAMRVQLARAFGPYVIYGPLSN